MKTLKGQLRVVLAAVTGVFLLFLLLPATVLAADNRTGQTVTVGPNEVVNDDLYVAANTIEIQGTINGDLIAVGTNITVSGTVTHDVMAAGSNISIPGVVQGTARLAGGQVAVTGKITGDLVAAAGTVSLANEASVGRDVMLSGGTVTLAGSITRDAQIAGGDIVISGPIGGNVTAWDTTLKLGTGAVINGNLDYTSNQTVSKAAGAVVGGYTHRAVPTNNGVGAVSWLIGWLQTLVGFFLLGSLLILLAPGFDRKAVSAFRAAPWSRLGIGFAAMVLVPVIAAMVFGIGLLVGGWWLAIFLMGIYVLALTVGYAIVAQMVGSFALDKLGRPNAHPMSALLLGLPVLMVISAIPVIGWAVGFVAVIYGLGVVAMALPWGRPQTPTSTAVVVPPAGMMRPTPSAG
jgi:cytoskeletal protein CcmA (bactofilin family)